MKKVLLLGLFFITVLLLTSCIDQSEEIVTEKKLTESIQSTHPDDDGTGNQPPREPGE